MEATGVSEVNDLIQKFATQGSTYENLKDLKFQNEKKLLTLTEKRQQVKDDLEKMKLEGLEALTRKQVEDMERNLALAESKHAKAKEEYDRVKKMLLDLQAGIEHLCGKLNEIQLYGGKSKNIDKVSQSNLVEGLEQARQKLKILYKDMKQDPELFEESLVHVKGGNNFDTKKVPRGNFFSKDSAAITNQNVRVKLPDKHDDDEGSDFDAQEDENERMLIKQKHQQRRKKV